LLATEPRVIGPSARRRAPPTRKRQLYASAFNAKAFSPAVAAGDGPPATSAARSGSAPRARRPPERRGGAGRSPDNEESLTDRRSRSVDDRRRRGLDRRVIHGRSSARLALENALPGEFSKRISPAGSL
jgi:hypothetical protein